jgi:Uma2 family endonuclease
MAENTKQFEYTVIIKCGLEALFRDRNNVFVAAGLFWYPVEGNNALRQAPDVLVAFGRPRGHRASYRQWEEGVAPQVVFEIFPSDYRLREMHRKFSFYQRHGVEEYYAYNPEDGELIVYERQGQELVDQLPVQGWMSRRLGVQFQLVGNDLKLYGPDGTRFASYLELVRDKEEAVQKARQERAEKEEALRQAEQERAEKEEALRQLEAQAEQLIRLRDRLKDLGLDPDAPSPGA